MSMKSKNRSVNSSEKMEGWTAGKRPRSRSFESSSLSGEHLSGAPPKTLLPMHRVMLQSHQLSDGTLLPNGAQISMAVNAIQNDPAGTPEPDIHLRWAPLLQTLERW